MIQKNKTHYDVILKYCTEQIFSAKINLPSQQNNEKRLSKKIFKLKLYKIKLQLHDKHCNNNKKLQQKTNKLRFHKTI